MRKLFSAATPCTGECKYCFAKWSSYVSQSAKLLAQEDMDQDQIILYPCCDGDFFSQKDLIDKVKQYTQKHKKVYISFSSKIMPTKDSIARLVDLNDWLISENKGFLKFAIAVSCKSVADIIEPGTMPYKMRVAFAQQIKDLGIPLSLTIKPVLPFIAEQEYASILQDFSSILKHVMIGGLYVDRESDFYKHYIKDKYQCTRRHVEWLSNCPEWDYVENEKLMSSIIKYSKQLNLNICMSDVEVVKSMIRGKQNGQFQGTPKQFNFDSANN